MIELRFFNRQRTRGIRVQWLRKIGAHLFNLLDVPAGEVGVHLVNATEMTRVNETYLQHGGSTDVITFDYSEGESEHPLSGEIFICVDEAIVQARHFRTTWQSEVVRYFVHGVLHLKGYDDLKAGPRRIMKREENRLLKELSQRFELNKLARARINTHER